MSRFLIHVAPRLLSDNGHYGSKSVYFDPKVMVLREASNPDVAYRVDSVKLTGASESVYQPDAPLKGGTVLWLSTEGQLIIKDGDREIYTDNEPLSSLGLTEFDLDDDGC